MANTQTIWGIDVGRCALKALKLRAAGDGKVEILAHDYVEHAKFLSQPDADRPALIAAALEKFLSRNDITRDRIEVGVPAQHTLARFTKLPPVQTKRIPDIVRYEAAQQIPFDMDEVIWDYQIFQEEGAPDLEVGIFAMKRELLREHLLHFEQVSIEPIAVQCGPLAVYNAALFDGLIEKDTTILIDIGADSTDLVIGTPNNQWTRTIQIGGNHLTETLVKSFKISFAQAETLKRTASSSKYARQIFQAMRPVFADLVQELQRSIGYYSQSHRDAKMERVIAVGNAMALPGLQKYLQQNLNMTVDKPESFRQAASEAPAGSQLAEQHLSFWVAYGLALQGLELTKVTSNLLPAEIARQIVWRKKRPAFAATAACLLLAGGVVWFRHSTDSKALAASSFGADGVKVTLEQALRNVSDGPSQSLSDRAFAKTVQLSGESIKKKFNELKGKGEDQIAETEDLAALLRQRSTVPGIFAAIHEALPKPDSADIATLPRTERKQVTLHAVNMAYVADVNDPVWKESIVTVPARITDPESVTRGFKIEIECSTPNSGGQKFIQTYMDALRTLGRQPKTGFFIDRVYLVEGVKGARKIAASSSAGSKGGHSHSSSTEVEGQVGKLDLITNEPTDSDWQFELWADVILEDWVPPDQEADGKEPVDENP
jgi:type IV pilus assembly protein PilM